MDLQQALPLKDEFYIERKYVRYNNLEIRMIYHFCKLCPFETKKIFHLDVFYGNNEILLLRSFNSNEIEFVFYENSHIVKITGQKIGRRYICYACGSLTYDFEAFLFDEVYKAKIILCRKCYEKFMRLLKLIDSLIYSILRQRLKFAEIKKFEGWKVRLNDKLDEIKSELENYDENLVRNWISNEVKPNTIISKLNIAIAEIMYNYGQYPINCKIIITPYFTSITSIGILGAVKEVIFKIRVKDLGIKYYRIIFEFPFNEILNKLEFILKDFEEETENYLNVSKKDIEKEKQKIENILTRMNIFLQKI